MAIVNVISFSPNVDRYQPDACIDILLPCECYTVTLLASANDDLNFFESTVLQLSGLGLKDKNEIRQLLGLETELCDFICDKLIQLHLINERIEISDEGLTLINKLKIRTVAPVTVNIYRNKITRQFLPMLLRPITAIQCAEENSLKLTFSVGNTGQNKKITAYYLKKNKCENTGSRLDEKAVLNIIERFKCLSRKNASLSNFPSHLYSNQNQRINIASEKEDVLVHCLAFIQKGDDKARVCDGFFSCYDMDLTKAFKREDELIKILKKIKHKVTNKELKKENITLQACYEKIIKEAAKNAFDVAKLDEEKSEYIVTAYSLIESRFAELALQYQVKDWKPYFTKSALQNGRVITGFAEELGFILHKAREDHQKLVNPLFLVKIGSIQHLKSAKPEMKPALAMLLLSATRNDQHPLKILAKKHPDLFKRLAKLHKYRNSLSHGDVNILKNISHVELSEIHELYMLLVGDENREISIEQTRQPKWQQDDVRFKHREKIFKLFGGHLIERMDNQILKQMEQALITANLEDGRSRVNALSSALQQSLFIANTVLISDENPVLRGGHFKKIKGSWGEGLPEKLLKTASNQIERAALGIESTLGATLIVYLSHESCENNTALREQNSQLLQNVAKLIEIRGHGGAVIGYSSELKKLEDMTFKFIYFLLENYCE